VVPERLHLFHRGDVAGETEHARAARRLGLQALHGRVDRRGAASADHDRVPEAQELAGVAVAEALRAAGDDDVAFRQASLRAGHASRVPGSVDLAEAY